MALRPRVDRAAILLSRHTGYSLADIMGLSLRRLLLYVS
jgi:hypothetical protein